MNTRILLALAGAVTLAACGSDKKEPTGPGGGAVTSSQVAFTGGVSKSLRGHAAFASDNSDADIGFALVLVDQEDESPEDMVFFYRGTPGIPGTGSIGLTDYANSEDEPAANEMVGIAILGAGTTSPRFCAASGGNLNVQTSSSSRLKGTFSMDMICSDISGESMVETRVTGSFDAAGGNVVIPN